MTARRTRLAALAGTAALACTGFALGASPASADTPTAPAATAHTNPCDRAPWGDRVQGAPKDFGAGSISGDYLWHTATGFHLRVTHAGRHDLGVYRGQITSSAPMRLDPVRLEGYDSVALSQNRKTITFSFHNHGYIDGFNFHTDCARSLTISHLRIDARPLPVTHVDLGYHKAHPKQVPFRVHRYGGPSKI